MVNAHKMNRFDNVDDENQGDNLGNDKAQRVCQEYAHQARNKNGISLSHFNTFSGPISSPNVSPSLVVQEMHLESVMVFLDEHR